MRYMSNLQFVVADPGDRLNGRTDARTRRSRSHRCRERGLSAVSSPRPQALAAALFSRLSFLHVGTSIACLPPSPYVTSHQRQSASTLVRRPSG